MLKILEKVLLHFERGRNYLHFGSNPGSLASFKDFFRGFSILMRMLKLHLIFQKTLGPNGLIGYPRIRKIIEIATKWTKQVILRKIGQKFKNRGKLMVCLTHYSPVMAKNNRNTILPL